MKKITSQKTSNFPAGATRTGGAVNNSAHIRTKINATLGGAPSAPWRFPTKRAASMGRLDLGPVNQDVRVHISKSSSSYTGPSTSSKTQTTTSSRTVEIPRLSSDSLLKHPCRWEAVEIRYTERDKQPEFGSGSGSTSKATTTITGLSKETPVVVSLKTGDGHGEGGEQHPSLQLNDEPGVNRQTVMVEKLHVRNLLNTIREQCGDLGTSRLSEYKPASALNSAHKGPHTLSTSSESKEQEGLAEEDSVVIDSCQTTSFGNDISSPKWLCITCLANDCNECTCGTARDATCVGGEGSNQQCSCESTCVSNYGTQNSAAHHYIDCGTQCYTDSAEITTTGTDTPPGAATISSAATLSPVKHQATQVDSQMPFQDTILICPKKQSVPPPPYPSPLHTSSSLGVRSAGAKRSPLKGQEADTDVHKLAYKGGSPDGNISSILSQQEINSYKELALRILLERRKFEQQGGSCGRKQQGLLRCNTSCGADRQRTTLSGITTKKWRSLSKCHGPLRFQARGRRGRSCDAAAVREVDQTGTESSVLSGARIREQIEKHKRRMHESPQVATKTRGRERTTLGRVKSKSKVKAGVSTMVSANKLDQGNKTSRVSSDSSHASREPAPRSKSGMGRPCNRKARDKCRDGSAPPAHHRQTRSMSPFSRSLFSAMLKHEQEAYAAKGLLVREDRNDRRDGMLSAGSQNNSGKIIMYDQFHQMMDQAAKKAKGPLSNAAASDSSRIKRAQLPTQRAMFGAESPEAKPMKAFTVFRRNLKPEEPCARQVKVSKILKVKSAGLHPEPRTKAKSWLEPSSSMTSGTNSTKRSQTSASLVRSGYDGKVQRQGQNQRHLVKHENQQKTPHFRKQIHHKNVVDNRQQQPQRQRLVQQSQQQRQQPHQEEQQHQPQHQQKRLSADIHHPSTTIIQNAMETEQPQPCNSEKIHITLNSPTITACQALGLHQEEPAISNSTNKAAPSPVSVDQILDCYRELLSQIYSQMGSLGKPSTTVAAAVSSSEAVGGGSCSSVAESDCATVSGALAKADVNLPPTPSNPPTLRRPAFTQRNRHVSLINLSRGPPRDDKKLTQTRSASTTPPESRKIPGFQRQTQSSLNKITSFTAQSKSVTPSRSGKCYSRASSCERSSSSVDKASLKSGGKSSETKPANQVQPSRVDPSRGASNESVSTDISAIVCISHPSPNRNPSVKKCNEAIRGPLPNLGVDDTKTTPACPKLSSEEDRPSFISKGCEDLLTKKFENAKVDLAVSKFDNILKNFKQRNQGKTSPVTDTGAIATTCYKADDISPCATMSPPQSRLSQEKAHNPMEQQSTAQGQGVVTSASQPTLDMKTRPSKSELLTNSGCRKLRGRSETAIESSSARKPPVPIQKKFLPSGCPPPMEKAEEDESRIPRQARKSDIQSKLGSCGAKGSGAQADGPGQDSESMTSQVLRQRRLAGLSAKRRAPGVTLVTLKSGTTGSENPQPQNNLVHHFQDARENQSFYTEVSNERKVSPKDDPLIEKRGQSIYPHRFVTNASASDSTLLIRNKQQAQIEPHFTSAYNPPSAEKSHDEEVCSKSLSKDRYAPHSLEEVRSGRLLSSKGIGHCTSSKSEGWATKYLKVDNNDQPQVTSIKSCGAVTRLASHLECPTLKEELTPLAETTLPETCHNAGALPPPPPPKPQGKRHVNQSSPEQSDISADAEEGQTPQPGHPNRVHGANYLEKPSSHVSEKSSGVAGEDEDLGRALREQAVAKTCEMVRTSATTNRHIHRDGPRDATTKRVWSWSEISSTDNPTSRQEEASTSPRSSWITSYTWDSGDKRKKKELDSALSAERPGEKNADVFPEKCSLAGPELPRQNLSGVATPYEARTEHSDVAPIEDAALSSDSWSLRAESLATRQGERDLRVNISKEASLMSMKQSSDSQNTLADSRHIVSNRSHRTSLDVGSRESGETAEACALNPSLQPSKTERDLSETTKDNKCAEFCARRTKLMRKAKMVDKLDKERLENLMNQCEQNHLLTSSTSAMLKADDSLQISTVSSKCSISERSKSTRNAKSSRDGELHYRSLLSSCRGPFKGFSQLPLDIPNHVLDESQETCCTLTTVPSREVSCHYTWEASRHMRDSSMHSCDSTTFTAVLTGHSTRPAPMTTSNAAPPDQPTIQNSLEPASSSTECRVPKADFHFLSPSCPGSDSDVASGQQTFSRATAPAGSSLMPSKTASTLITSTTEAMVFGEQSRYTHNQYQRDITQGVAGTYYALSARNGITSHTQEVAMNTREQGFVTKTQHTRETKELRAEDSAQSATSSSISASVTSGKGCKKAAFSVADNALKSSVIPNLKDKETSSPSQGLRPTQLSAAGRTSRDGKALHLQDRPTEMLQMDNSSRQFTQESPNHQVINHPRLCGVRESTKNPLSSHNNEDIDHNKIAPQAKESTCLHLVDKPGAQFSPAPGQDAIITVSVFSQSPGAKRTDGIPSPTKELTRSKEAALGHIERKVLENLEMFVASAKTIRSGNSNCRKADIHFGPAKEPNLSSHSAPPRSINFGQARTAYSSPEGWAWTDGFDVPKYWPRSGCSHESSVQGTELQKVDLVEQTRFMANKDTAIGFGNNYISSPAPFCSLEKGQIPSFGKSHISEPLPLSLRRKNEMTEDDSPDRNLVPTCFSQQSPGKSIPAPSMASIIHVTTPTRLQISKLSPLESSRQGVQHSMQHQNNKTETGSPRVRNILSPTQIMSLYNSAGASGPSQSPPSPERPISPQRSFAAARIPESLPISSQMPTSLIESPTYQTPLANPFSANQLPQCKVVPQVEECMIPSTTPDGVNFVLTEEDINFLLKGLEDDKGKDTHYINCSTLTDRGQGSVCATAGNDDNLILFSEDSVSSPGGLNLHACASESDTFSAHTHVGAITGCCYPNVFDSETADSSQEPVMLLISPRRSYSSKHCEGQYHLFGKRGWYQSCKQASDEGESTVSQDCSCCTSSFNYINSEECVVCSIFQSSHSKDHGPATSAHITSQKSQGHPDCAGNHVPDRHGRRKPFKTSRRSKYFRSSSRAKRLWDIIGGKCACHGWRDSQSDREMDQLPCFLNTMDMITSKVIKFVYSLRTAKKYGNHPYGHRGSKQWGRSWAFNPYFKVRTKRQRGAQARTRRSQSTASHKVMAKNNLAENSTMETFSDTGSMSSLLSPHGGWETEDEDKETVHPSVSTTALACKEAASVRSKSDQTYVRKAKRRKVEKSLRNVSLNRYSFAALSDTRIPNEESDDLDQSHSATQGDETQVFEPFTRDNSICGPCSGLHCPGSASEQSRAVETNSLTSVPCCNMNSSDMRRTGDQRHNDSVRENIVKTKGPISPLPPPRSATKYKDTARLSSKEANLRGESETTGSSGSSLSLNVSESLSTLPLSSYETGNHGKLSRQRTSRSYNFYNFLTPETEQRLPFKGRPTSPPWDQLNERVDVTLNHLIRCCTASSDLRTYAPRVVFPLIYELLDPDICASIPIQAPVMPTLRIKVGTEVQSEVTGKCRVVVAYRHNLRPEKSPSSENLAVEAATGEQVITESLQQEAPTKDPSISAVVEEREVDVEEMPRVKTRGYLALELLQELELEVGSRAQWGEEEVEDEEEIEEVHPWQARHFSQPGLVPSLNILLLASSEESTLQLGDLLACTGLTQSEIPVEIKGETAGSPNTDPYLDEVPPAGLPEFLPFMGNGSAPVTTFCYPHNVVIFDENCDVDDGHFIHPEENVLFCSGVDCVIPENVISSPDADYDEKTILSCSDPSLCKITDPLTHCALGETQGSTHISKHKIKQESHPSSLRNREFEHTFNRHGVRKLRPFHTAPCNLRNTFSRSRPQLHPRKQKRESQHCRYCKSSPQTRRNRWERPRRRLARDAREVSALSSPGSGISCTRRHRFRRGESPPLSADEVMGPTSRRVRMPTSPVTKPRPSRPLLNDHDDFDLDTYDELGSFFTEMQDTTSSSRRWEAGTRRARADNADCSLTFTHTSTASLSETNLIQWTLFSSLSSISSHSSTEDLPKAYTCKDTFTQVNSSLQAHAEAYGLPGMSGFEPKKSVSDKSIQTNFEKFLRNPDAAVCDMATFGNDGRQAEPALTTLATPQYSLLHDFMRLGLTSFVENVVENKLKKEPCCCSTPASPSAWRNDKTPVINDCTRDASPARVEQKMDWTEEKPKFDYSGQENATQTHSASLLEKKEMQEKSTSMTLFECVMDGCHVRQRHVTHGDHFDDVNKGVVGQGGCAFENIDSLTNLATQEKPESTVSNASNVYLTQRICLQKPLQPLPKLELVKHNCSSISEPQDTRLNATNLTPDTPLDTRDSTTSDATKRCWPTSCPIAYRCETQSGSNDPAQSGISVFPSSGDLKNSCSSRKKSLPATLRDGSNSVASEITRVIPPRSINRSLNTSSNTGSTKRIPPPPPDKLTEDEGHLAAGSGNDSPRISSTCDLTLSSTSSSSHVDYGGLKDVLSRESKALWKRLTIMENSCDGCTQPRKLSSSLDSPYRIHQTHGKVPRRHRRQVERTDRSCWLQIPPHVTDVDSVAAQPPASCPSKTGQPLPAYRLSRPKDFIHHRNTRDSGKAIDSSKTCFPRDDFSGFKSQHQRVPRDSSGKYVDQVKHKEADMTTVDRPGPASRTRFLTDPSLALKRKLGSPSSSDGVPPVKRSSQSSCREEDNCLTHIQSLRLNSRHPKVLSSRDRVVGGAFRRPGSLGFGNTARMVRLFELGTASSHGASHLSSTLQASPPRAGHSELVCSGCSTSNNASSDTVSSNSSPPSSPRPNQDSSRLDSNHVTYTATPGVQHKTKDGKSQPNSRPSATLASQDVPEHGGACNLRQDPKGASSKWSLTEVGPKTEADQKELVKPALSKSTLQRQAGPSQISPFHLNSPPKAQASHEFAVGRHSSPDADLCIKTLGNILSEIRSTFPGETSLSGQEPRAARTENLDTRWPSLRPDANFSSHENPASWPWNVNASHKTGDTSHSSSSMGKHNPANTEKKRAGKATQKLDSLWQDDDSKDSSCSTKKYSDGDNSDEVSRTSGGRDESLMGTNGRMSGDLKNTLSARTNKGNFETTPTGRNRNRNIEDTSASDKRNGIMVTKFNYDDMKDGNLQALSNGGKREEIAEVTSKGGIKDDYLVGAPYSGEREGNMEVICYNSMRDSDKKININVHKDMYPKLYNELPLSTKEISCATGVTNIDHQSCSRGEPEVPPRNYRTKSSLELGRRKVRSCRHSGSHPQLKRKQRPELCQESNKKLRYNDVQTVDRIDSLSCACSDRCHEKSISDTPSSQMIPPQTVLTFGDIRSCPTLCTVGDIRAQPEGMDPLVQPAKAMGQALGIARKDGHLRVETVSRSSRRFASVTTIKHRDMPCTKIESSTVLHVSRDSSPSSEWRHGSPDRPKRGHFPGDTGYSHSVDEPETSQQLTPFSDAATPSSLAGRTVGHKSAIFGCAGLLSDASSPEVDHEIPTESQNYANSTIGFSLTQNFNNDTRTNWENEPSLPQEIVFHTDTKVHRKTELEKPCTQSSQAGMRDESHRNDVKRLQAELSDRCHDPEPVHPLDLDTQRTRFNTAAAEDHEGGVPRQLYPVASIQTIGGDGAPDSKLSSPIHSLQEVDVGNNELKTSRSHVLQRPSDSRVSAAFVLRDCHTRAFPGARDESRPSMQKIATLSPTVVMTPLSSTSVMTSISPEPEMTCQLRTAVRASTPPTPEITCRLTAPIIASFDPTPEITSNSVAAAMTLTPSEREVKTTNSKEPSMCSARSSAAKRTTWARLSLNLPSILRGSRQSSNQANNQISLANADKGSDDPARPVNTRNHQQKELAFLQTMVSGEERQRDKHPIGKDRAHSSHKPDILGLNEPFTKPLQMTMDVPVTQGPGLVSVGRLAHHARNADNGDNLKTQVEPSNISTHGSAQSKSNILPRAHQKASGNGLVTTQDSIPAVKTKHEGFRKRFDIRNILSFKRRGSPCQKKKS